LYSTEESARRSSADGNMEARVISGNCENGFGKKDFWGDVYEGQWRFGQPHGKGVMTYQSGCKLRGAWVDGFMRGGTITYPADGATWTGQFVMENPARGSGVWRFPGVGEVDGAGPGEGWKTHTTAPACWRDAVPTALPAAEAPCGAGGGGAGAEAGGAAVVGASSTAPAAPPPTITVGIAAPGAPADSGGDGGGSSSSSSSDEDET
jgi:hypothetical protein